jgi:NAD(P)-dependent dehydrogenase (short-subunit alcohol dehydrogenase family)
MNTRVFVVTGTTAGIGKAVAHELAKTGDTVVMVARDGSRGTRAHKEVSSATQNPNIDLQLGDLGNLASVRNLATVIKNRYNKIDGLINSASVYRKNRTTTVDGFETMFATNHLGPFLFTYLLLDNLKASGSARILNITAPATNRLNFEDLQGEKQFNSLNSFGATKMANLLFTFELARRLQNTGVQVSAIHPGLVRSQLMREAIFPIRWLTSLFSAPASRVAAEIAQIVTTTEYANMHGKFLHKGKEIEAPAYALDPANQSRLWEISEQLTDAREVLAHGAEYDPTGSVAMFDNEDVPETMTRPQDNQRKK